MDTLTHPQFLRALSLSRRHSHGWATQLDLLGVDSRRRPDELVYYRVQGDGGQVRCGDALERRRPGDLRLCGDCGQGGPSLGCGAVLERREDPGEWPSEPSGSERRWERDRRHKLLHATAAELAALARLEAAISRGEEIAVEDISAVALIGSSEWPDLSGIWAPELDADGHVTHRTCGGAGRLGWIIRRDGSASVEVYRPGATRRESITVLVAEVGGEVVTREYGDGRPGSGHPVRTSSLSVERVGETPIYLRHVLALRDTLATLGVSWDPAVEVG